MEQSIHDGAKHAMRHHMGDGQPVLNQVMYKLASHRLYMSLTVHDPVQSRLWCNMLYFAWQILLAQIQPDSHDTTKLPV